MDNSKFGVCPLFTFQKVVSGKWMLPILHRLERSGSLRFGELLHCFPEITKATLTKQLRKLEEIGFLRREESEGYPCSVEYSLSELGREFLGAFDQVENWCEIYLADKAARNA